MKKILILVMSHNGGEIFDGYKKVWDEKIKIIKDKLPIDVLFLYSNSNLEQQYQVIDNNLISKCHENYWSSLLLKTINGFDYFVKNDYDLVFKTNLSTLINFDVFYEYCLTLNINEYIYEGVIGKYQNYNFCSGAGMLLNKKSANLVLENRDKINETWTDDIFIGYILNKLSNIEPNQNGLTRFDVSHDTILTDELKKYTHIRIKIRSGDKDIYYTNEVFKLLYNK